MENQTPPNAPPAAQPEVEVNVSTERDEMHETTGAEISNLASSASVLLGRSVSDDQFLATITAAASQQRRHYVVKRADYLRLVELAQCGAAAGLVGSQPTADLIAQPAIVAEPAAATSAGISVQAAQPAVEPVATAVAAQPAAVVQPTQPAAQPASTPAQPVAVTPEPAAIPVAAAPVQPAVVQPTQPVVQEVAQPVAQPTPAQPVAVTPEQPVAAQPVDRRLAAADLLRQHGIEIDNATEQQIAWAESQIPE